MSRKLRFASMVTLAFTVAATLWVGAGASGAVVSSKLTGLDEPGRIGGTYLVALKPGVVPAASVGSLRSAARSLTSRIGGRVSGTFTESPVFIFEGSLAQAKELAADPSVRGVEADRKVKLADVLATKTSGATRRMRANHNTATDAFDAGYKGNGEHIGIIDTGIELFPSVHSEFTGRIFDQTATSGATDDALPNTAICRRSAGANVVEVGSGLSPDGKHRYGDDKNGHGTRTAGNAAAGGVSVYGVAPEAVLVVARTALRASNVASCIDYMTSLNADPDPLNNVPIVNISLAYGAKGPPDACHPDNLLKATAVAICALSTSLPGGVFITAAAGNNAANALNTAPGKYTQVVSVSALCDRAQGAGATLATVGEHSPGDGICGFSNFGPTVDFMATGASGGTTDATKGEFSPSVGGGYMYSAGTSRAAPRIAGLAAVLNDAVPGLNVAAMRTFMELGSICANGAENNIGGSCDSDGTNQGEWPRVRYSDFLVVGSDRDAANTDSAEPYPLVTKTLCEASAGVILGTECTPG